LIIFFNNLYNSGVYYGEGKNKSIKNWITCRKVKNAASFPSTGVYKQTEEKFSGD